MSGQETKVLVHIRLSREIVEKIDKLRETPRGTITRAEFLENLIKRALEEGLVNDTGD